MKVDPDGLLWVHVAYGAGDKQQTRLEIIDSAARSLLPSQSWSADVSYMPRSNHAFARSSNSDGDKVFTMMRMRLVGR